MESAWRNDLFNVTPNIEQTLSFKLLEKNHFQEIFHWIGPIEVKIKTLELLMF